MKKLAVLLLMLMAALAAVAQTSTLSAGATPSPAERSMAQANRLIEKNPKNFEAYNALALALSRRARETSDVLFYAQAEETLKKSFEISPGNFDGERIHVWLLLGKHEFAAAREEARKLNQKMPDDVMVYGFLTDANIELGNYKEAEDSAQLMLDLRPGNLPGSSGWLHALHRRGRRLSRPEHWLLRPGARLSRRAATNGPARAALLVRCERHPGSCPTARARPTPLRDAGRDGTPRTNAVPWRCRCP